MIWAPGRVTQGNAMDSRRASCSAGFLCEAAGDGAHHGVRRG